jgi:6-pyruvoyl-tetrahydropterin synthase
MVVWAECHVSAAHTLKGYGIHGHTYTVRVSVDVSKRSIDAEELRDALMDARRGVDHRCLDDVLPASTMEELARWFARALSPRFRVAEVAVSRPEGLGCQLAL